MLGRSAALNSLVLLFGLLATLVTAAEAKAHRLIVDCHVLPGGKVQVESWFDRGGSPKSAKVHVFHAGDQLLTEGDLDANGIFVFSTERPEQLRVIVLAGDGHRAERIIREDELARSLGGHTAASRSNNDTENGAPPVPLSDRSSRVTATDVLAGVGFLLAVAAFVLSWRNTWRLRRLRSKTRKQEPPGDLGCGHGLE